MMDSIKDALDKNNFFMPPCGFDADIKECAVCGDEVDIYKGLINSDNIFICYKCATKSILLTYGEGD